MIFELESTTDDSAIFNIEYIDEVWSNWSGYNISVGDLDNDGLKEIYTVGMNTSTLLSMRAPAKTNTHIKPTSIFPQNCMKEQIRELLLLT